MSENERAGLSNLHRLDRLLDIEEAAQILHVSHRTMYAWRQHDPPKGPRGILVGKHLRFHPDDLLEFIGEPRGRRTDLAPETSTSEEG